MTLNELLPLISCYSEVVIKERKEECLDADFVRETGVDPHLFPLFDSHEDLYGHLFKLNFDDFKVDKISSYPVYIEIIVTRKESR